MSSAMVLHCNFFKTKAILRIHLLPLGPSLVLTSTWQDYLMWWVACCCFNRIALEHDCTKNDNRMLRNCRTKAGRKMMEWEHLYQWRSLICAAPFGSKKLLFRGGMTTVDREISTQGGGFKGVCVAA